METNKVIVEELFRNGYARKEGKKSWNIAERRFLYLTPELSKGFLELRKFDKYKKNVVDREVSLMKGEFRDELRNANEEPFNLIDVCCGDGKKVIEFFKELNPKTKVCYCPVNVSEYLVNLALENVKKANFPNVVSYCPNIMNWDGESVGKLAKRERKKNFGRNVILLLGSVLASFDINNYLFELSRRMHKNDYLVIGNGIRIGERLAHLESYQHEVFDNWFIHLMQGIGFKRDELEYDARFGNSRVEMFYKIKVNKTVPYNGKEIVFEKGDEVLVAYLYKYYEEELNKFCKMYFSEVDIVKDKENEYALVVCKK